jgi:uncharacterized membrane protein YhhN
MIMTLLLGWTFVFAVLAILAQKRESRFFIFLVRPIPLLLLISLILESGKISSPFYRYALAAGLIVSLLTDFFLMLQKRRFKMETGGFILAHALYALAILSTERLEILSLPTGILLLYAAVIGFLLIRHRPHSGILSLLYVAVTAICASAAFGMVLRRPEPGPMAAALGVSIILVSDALLVVDRCLKPIKVSQTFVLGAFYAAQAFIALSACL